ncbi:unnamed protein product [Spirodela intermedia]|uniref:Uncharacterized protein n=1 Tax=Spirodela intermedia TaxID=51605 RepID=A0A7I8IJ26_SPIIN|nr:unnamed protein product [Spirodela intermedia]CAA6657818.1 unnamed protein product [Spirodela intermedia]
MDGCGEGSREGGRPLIS